MSVIPSMVRPRAQRTSFVICNEGYTIERYIHGMDASYNDIQEWKNKELVDVFGGRSIKAKTFQVKTKKEADELFKDKTFSSATVLQVRSLKSPGLRVC